MSDHIERSVDKWLKWSALIGPIIGFILGNCSGAIITYQSIQNDRAQIVTIANRVANIEGWKTSQEEFNRTTIAAIARLKALIKDVP